MTNCRRVATETCRSPSCLSSLRGYQSAWLTRDIVAGVTLAAVAIPECMGYTSIAQTPVVTGLYTVIFPTLLFALLGSSGCSSSGPTRRPPPSWRPGWPAWRSPGLTPDSPEWLAYSSLIALVCGGLLFLARLLRLGFLGDFLSRLGADRLPHRRRHPGVHRADPRHARHPQGHGQLVRAAVDVDHDLARHRAWRRSRSRVGTMVIIFGFKRFLPRCRARSSPCCSLIVVSAVPTPPRTAWPSSAPCRAGSRRSGCRRASTWSTCPSVLGIAFSCFVLIIAQSAATSRSFAMKHGQRVDVNRDIVGLAGANFAAGLTGTFVVNGSPTKTQILDEQKGRTQLANLTMSASCCCSCCSSPACSPNMPKAVLGGDRLPHRRRA